MALKSLVGLLLVNDYLLLKYVNISFIDFPIQIHARPSGVIPRTMLDAQLTRAQQSAFVLLVLMMYLTQSALQMALKIGPSVR